MTTDYKNLLQLLEEIKAKKSNAIKDNQFELASSLRDYEKVLEEKIQKMDNLNKSHPLNK